MPALYAIFTVLRGRLGAPTAVSERLGRVLAERKSFVAVRTPTWPQGILAIIDGSQASEAALVAAVHCSHVFGVPWAARLVAEQGPANEPSGYLRILDEVFGPHRRTSAIANAGEDRASRIPTGSVVERLLEELDCSLLIVPATAETIATRVIAA